MALTTEDRLEIAELHARFAWNLDLHEFEALRELFTDDVHYVGVGREYHDIDALIASFTARDVNRTTRHGLGNSLLTEQPDGTVAGRSSWHTWASNAEPGGTQPPGSYMVADFLDRFVRTARGWRIAERVIVPVFRDSSLSPTTGGKPS